MESKRSSGEGAGTGGDAVLGGVFRGRRLHSMRPLEPAPVTESRLAEDEQGRPGDHDGGEPPSKA